MQEAVQEAVPEQPELSLEQAEDALFEEATALAGFDQEESVPQNEASQADPVPTGVAEDAGEKTPVEVPLVETAPPDPFADATPEQRQAFSQLVEDKAHYEHDSMSNRNRVSALQKKINELEAAAETRAAKPPEIPEPAKADLVEADDGTDLKEFQEDFPVIYDAVNGIYKQQVGQMQQRFDSQLEVLTQKIQSVAQPVERIQETEQNAYRKHQLDALATVHADWREVQNSKEFWDWLDDQSDGIRALSGSVAAADNIALLNIFKSQVQPQQAAPQAQQRPPQPRRQPDVALPRVSSGGRPSEGIPPNDEDAAWKYWSEHYDQL